VENNAMKKLMESVLGEKYGKLFKVTVNGKTWYLAKSLCRVLDLKNTSVAVKGGSTRIGYFGIDQDDIYKLGGYRNSPLYISEYGVWKLILKSRKPAALVIKRMLSEKVLTEIMRTGAYQGV
jgi:anti-repressor protein